MYEIGEDKRSSMFGRRSGRKEYWISIGLLTVSSVLVSVVWPSNGSAAGFVWFILYAWRLHDIGRSGWWAGLLLLFQWSILILAAFAAWRGFLYLLASAGTEPGPSTAEVLIAGGAISAAILAQIAFTVWLGLRPGDPGANRFGPPPGRRRLRTSAVGS